MKTERKISSLKMESLYIVIPAYNEEKNIKKTIEEWYPIAENHNRGGGPDWSSLMMAARIRLMKL